MRGSLLHSFTLPHAQHAALAGPILIGLGFGVLTRALLLRADAGPFPSHPHGQINYLFLGLVAAVLGSLAPAALFTADYTAGVFLAIGLSQFHTVRQIERDMLVALDRAAVVRRGRPYVEGLSMMLETRNYLVMVTAMAASAAAILLGLLAGAAVGLAVALVVLALARAGADVSSVAVIRPAEVARDGADLLVGGVPVRRGAPPAMLAQVSAALGLALEPRDLAGRLTLAEPGQRQAVLHNLTAQLGIRSVFGDWQGADDEKRAQSDWAGDARPLLPAATLEPESGRVLLLLFPQVHRPARAVRIAGRTPLLETLAHSELRGQDPAGGQD